MTNERVQAYQRVLKTLEDKGATKLQPAEADTLREAADTLVLAATLDLESCAAVADVEKLAKHLVEAGRWELSEADLLVATVRGCGPEETPAEMATATA